MTATFDHETAKRFVRDTLGCQCPESVFDQIDYQENSDILGKDVIVKRLLVGNRLLIYVLEIDNVKSLPILLPRLVRNAKLATLFDSTMCGGLVQNQTIHIVSNSRSEFFNILKCNDKII